VSNYRPLSKIMAQGLPKRVIMFRQMNFHTSAAVMDTTASTLIHLVE